MPEGLRSASFYRESPRGLGGGVAKQRRRGYTGWLKRSWLSSIGFFSRTTFPIKNKWEVWTPIAPKWLGLESWNFIRKLLWPIAISIPILVLPSGELSKKLRFKVPVDSNGGQKVKWPLFSQTASILHFWSGNWLHPFWPENPKEDGFRVSPKPTFQFYCGKPEVDKGKILVGTGRPSGVFHPWKYGKDRIRTG